MVETQEAYEESDRPEARENRLNDLSGKEWIKFTKSWFVHRPEPRGDQKIRHPASFPESLIREFVLFFTKKGQLVVDPFLGTGSTLVASAEVDRAGIGFEIVDKYADISRKRVEEVLNTRRGRVFLTGEKTPWAEVIHGNSKHLSSIWKERGIPPADYCITSPPYCNQLKRNHIRQKGRVEKGRETVYSADPDEIGNIVNYQDFMRQMKII